MHDHPVVLVDTNVIIECVRTGCWRALTGRVVVETVETCVSEAKRGEEQRSGYVAVSDDDLARISGVHAVSETDRAALVLAYPDSVGMDPGERDLFAHAYGRNDETWLLASADKASVRAAVMLGCEDRLQSVGRLLAEIGCRPHPPLRRHFEEVWLTESRTRFLLEGGIR